MMKKYITLAILIPSLSLAEQFQVTDVDSGMVYGPFSFTNSAVLNIRTNRFVLTRLTTNADKLTERLKTIVIPSIEFRDARLQDVINFLVEASIAKDPEGTGANIVLSRTIQTESPESKTNHGMVESGQITGSETMPTLIQRENDTITLNLRRISLYDAISIITELAGMQFVVDDRNVVILKDGKPIPTRK